MRVLLSTQSAATRTSFATVCRQIWTRIHAADPSIEIIQHGWFHHPVVEDVPWEIIPTRCPTLDEAPSALADSYGDSSFAEVVERVRPDIVWHLGDPYMGQAPAALAAQAGYRLVWYYPVAREPFNHYRREWVSKLAAADLVAATRFGSELLAAVPGLEGREIPFIHHGVDTATFRPVDPAERARLRAEIGGGAVDDHTFVLGWVGHDQYRKQVWVLYELLHLLRSGEWILCRRCDRVTPMEYDHLRRAPREVGRLRTYSPAYDYKTCWHCGSDAVERGRPRDDVVLWTVMPINLEVGWDLRLLVHTYRLGDAVFDSSPSQPAEGHSFEEMAEIFNCFDALVFPSGAEGFGMPVLEAMACGVPVVYGNYSAHAEFAVGLPVRTRFVPDTPDPSFLGFVDMGDMLRNVLRLMDDAPLRESLSGRALEKAQRMDWDAFTSRWLAVLGE